MTTDKKHRLSVSLIVAVLLWAALAGAVALWVTHSDTAAPPKQRAAAQTKFSHVYPDEPAGYERPAVGSNTPVVDAAHRIGHARQLSSLTALAAALPANTLVRLGHRTWRLDRPVELQDRTLLRLHGPARLLISQGAYLVVQSDASLVMTDMTVQALWRTHGERQTRGQAGFIVARSGATMRLTADTFHDMGHLASQAYGITFDAASTRSALLHCHIDHAYFGVYLAKMRGTRVIGNTIDHSAIYGIDPHTYNDGLVIAGNTVLGSGVHGIILADHTSHSSVTDNTVLGAADHGLVLYQHSDDNTITDNHVSGTFDGIVVTDSSRNTFTRNVVGRVHRFGVRISGLADANVFRANTVGPAIVGFYLYSGPTANRIIDARFRSDYEHVRIRNDAPRNTVSPRPGRSELG